MAPNAPEFRLIPAFPAPLWLWASLTQPLPVTVTSEGTEQWGCPCWLRLLRAFPLAPDASGPRLITASPAPSSLWESLPLPSRVTGNQGCPCWLRGSPCTLALCRRARFKRSNSVTAGVQADLELEGFTGLAVATEDKALQFGRPFQRHSSEPETGRQYAVYKTVHTQGQWAYREDYQLQYDTVEVPRRDAWMERGSRSLPDSGRASPCHRDGEWFIKLLQAEVEKMEGWCQQMEREAEDYDLPEESEFGGVLVLGETGTTLGPLWSISPAKAKEVEWGQGTPGNPLGLVGSGGGRSCPMV